MFIPKKTIKQYVTKNIFASDYKINMVITGGGQSIINTIFQHPGASKTIQGMFVPYSSIMLEMYLGGWPVEQYCSEKTSQRMAQTAYRDSIIDTNTDGFNIGVGVTSSIKTSPERKGREHRFYITIIKKDVTINFYGLLNNQWTRQQQEELINNIILTLLVTSCKLSSFSKLYPYYFDNLIDHLHDYAFSAN